MKRGESLAEWLARVEANNERLNASEHYVYRAWDESGLLLYIGCSVNVERRMGGHRSTSTWARFAESITVDGPYPTKAEGRAAEHAAIESEGSFFAATRGDTKRTQANLLAAYRALDAIDIREPKCTRAMLDDEALYAIHEAEYNAYRELVDEFREALKTGAFPYLTDGDRLDNYLAARAQAAQRDQIAGAA